jgi:hypothetical protein
MKTRRIRAGWYAAEYLGHDVLIERIADKSSTDYGCWTAYVDGGGAWEPRETKRGILAAVAATIDAGDI